MSFEIREKPSEFERALLVGLGLPGESRRERTALLAELEDLVKNLGIGIAEEFPFGEYPCIKCNINRSAEGGATRIYHLPFDQQYDSCVINAPGEFMAMTTAEAEAAGFRRAYRWHNQ